MKILMVANGNFFSTFGGGQVYVKNLIDEMINQKMDVSIISFVNQANSNSEATLKKYRGNPIYEVTHSDTNRIKNIIRQVAPEIIHAHAQKALISSICKEFSIPCVITAHHGGIVCPAGTLMNDKEEICQSPVSQKECLPCVLKNTKGGTSFYPFLRRTPLSIRLKIGKFLSKLPFMYFITPIGMSSWLIERKRKEWQEIISNADLMIAPSQAMADNMALNGLNKAKIKVLPHGIPLSPSKRNHFPDRTTDHKIKFFCIGRICYIKGIHVLLNAFSQLNENRCELHLIGEADKKYEKELNKRYNKLKNIIFHGKIDPTEVTNCIKGFDILVHPTICLEVFGLNIAESLSEGKPVIATRCGGPEMQITNGLNGLLVEPNQADQLRDAMQWMIDHPDRVKEMSEKAPQNVISIEKHVNELSKIYSDILVSYGKQ